jgi:O-methyltransferase
MSMEQLLDKYPIISAQISRPALSVVLHELEKVLQNDVAGDVAEFGCYIGTTSLFLRRVLDGHGSDKRFFAYDSFKGLPSKTIQDASAAGSDFKAGELRVSKRRFLQEFKRARLAPPLTHKAWFHDLKDRQLPEQLAFAFLDGDFYESIMDSLRLVWPRLAPGGTIAIDDYNRETLPGVERAVRGFFQGKSIRLRHEHNIAIITL